MTTLSVVIPVYGCAGCLTELYKRLVSSLEKITHEFEIIFVDDCGPDHSWKILSELALANSQVKVIRLSKNFGQHLAITAGLAESSNEWVIVMDCDLQDPPEEIPRLLNTAQQGFDIVFARRIQKQHSGFRKNLSNLYFKFMDLVSKHKFNAELGSFSLISRKVVNAFLKMSDSNRHYLFILYWLGFKTGYIEYEHKERFCGKSSYTLKTLIKHALNGLLFQSTTLLHWIIYLGFSVSAMGFSMAIYFIYRYYVHSAYPGWTSLIVLILVIGGIILSSLGVVGLYIAGIFDQVKGRPLYVIDERISSDELRQHSQASE